MGSNKNNETNDPYLIILFPDPADKHPLTIKGINNPNLFLISVRQRKMSHRFYDMMEICIEKVEEERIKGRSLQIFSKCILMLQKEREGTPNSYFSPTSRGLRKNIDRRHFFGAR